MTTMHQLFDGSDAQSLPQGVSVPAFSAVAASKLAELQAQGFTVSGYSIERTESAEQVTRGFIDHSGLVGWWMPESRGLPTQPA